MSTKTTAIQWTDRTANPTRGCWPVSPGCLNCYAARHATRMSGEGRPYESLANGGRWTGQTRFVPEVLLEMLTWRAWAKRFRQEHGRRPRVFLNSMSDLFLPVTTHGGFNNVQIAAVFGVMAALPEITFQVLTKHADRMRAWFEWIPSFATVQRAIGAAPSERHTCMNALYSWLGETPRAKALIDVAWAGDGDRGPWPLPNVALGVSVEDQPRARRVHDLLRTPAWKRFVSYEPALEWVDFGSIDLGDQVSLDAFTGAHSAPCAYPGGPLPPILPPIDQIIVGGESGRGARPFRVNWAYRLRHACRAAGVALFVKQLGAHVIDRNDAGFDGEADGDDRPTCWPDVETDNWHLDPSRQYQGADARVLLRDSHGGDPAEWPPALRVREFPRGM